MNFYWPELHNLCEISPPWEFFFVHEPSHGPPGTPEKFLQEKCICCSKLQGDLKTTKIEEMKLQMEQFYREVVRLSQLKNTTTNGHR